MPLRWLTMSFINIWVLHCETFDRNCLNRSFLCIEFSEKCSPLQSLKVFFDVVTLCRRIPTHLVLSQKWSLRKVFKHSQLISPYLANVSYKSSCIPTASFRNRMESRSSSGNITKICMQSLTPGIIDLNVNFSFSGCFCEFYHVIVIAGTASTVINKINIQVAWM